MEIGTKVPRLRLAEVLVGDGTGTVGRLHAQGSSSRLDALPSAGQCRSLY